MSYLFSRQLIAASLFVLLGAVGSVGATPQPTNTQTPGGENAAAKAKKIADENAAAKAKKIADENAAAKAKKIADENAAAKAKRIADENAAAKAKEIADEKAAAGVAAQTALNDFLEAVEVDYERRDVLKSLKAAGQPLSLNSAELIDLRLVPDSLLPPDIVRVSITSDPFGLCPTGKDDDPSLTADGKRKVPSDVRSLRAYNAMCSCNREYNESDGEQAEAIFWHWTLFGFGLAGSIATGILGAALGATSAGLAGVEALSPTAPNWIPGALLGTSVASLLLGSVSAIGSGAFGLVVSQANTSEWFATYHNHGRTVNEARSKLLLFSRRAPGSASQKVDSLEEICSEDPGRLAPTDFSGLTIGEE